jgi:aldehyde:ferredoxin oxidoreductase
MALYKACKDAEGLAEWSRYGTTVVTSWCDEVGALPTRNFSAGSFEQGSNIYGQTMRKEIVITDKGCFGCPSPCGKYSNMKRYNTQVEGPEYETIGMMGSNLGIGDIQAVAEANRLADDMGIDSISAGGCIGWAMECYEKGIFTKADTDGLELKFGNIEAVFALIRKIAYREGKIGQLLAQGTKKAAQQVVREVKIRHPVKGWNTAYATHMLPPWLA